MPDLRRAGGPDRLVSPDGTTIFQCTDRDTYRFSDARMRSYIRHLLL